MLAVGLAVTLTVADMAEARRAGGSSSFGSRGTRTFDAPAATRTAPTSTQPVERTMTPQTQQNRAGQTSTAQNAAGQRSGFFGGLGGGLLGGLLMGGLFGMLLGTGFGGGFGFLGLLLQGAAIGLLIMFLMRRFGNRGQQPAYGAAGGPAGMARAPVDEPQRPGFEIPRMGQVFGSSKPKNPDEIGVKPSDLDTFEGLLKEMQRAYAAEDYAALRKITTPEAMSYLAEELSENATRGVKNEVRDVHLLQGDVSESWREADVEYATVAMRYESIDVLRERATGQIITGDPDQPTESVEVWTFMRRRGNDWLISAIQAGA